MALSLARYIWWEKLEYNPSLLFRLLKERNEEDHERSMGITIQNGDCLPESLIIEILSWLPVKDLLQHKSVCKSWYAIISSPDFISKHLKNYYRHNNDWRRCLLAQYYLTHAEPQVYAMLMDETYRVVTYEKLYDIPMYAPEVCGPCDGLYCLYGGGECAFWNPAINELKMLPPIAGEYSYIDSTTDVGFGYNELNKDYKMVVIQRHWGDATGEFEGAKDPQSVFVYSLKNDSWKHCGDLGRYYWLDENTCYNFVNGCCYWIEASRKYGGYTTCDSIISFDMNTDIFEEIKLPSYSQSTAKSLAIYDDSLALLSLGDDQCLEIWTLKAGLWCMKNKMGPFLDVMHPLGHWKDNIIMLEMKDHNLVLLDPESQDIKYLSFQNATLCCSIFVYMESLVSIKCKNCRPDEDHNITNNARPSISSSDSGMEFGIRELFCSEATESDSEFGIHELFC